MRSRAGVLKGIRRATHVYQTIFKTTVFLMRPRAGVIKDILWATHARQTILKTSVVE